MSVFERWKHHKTKVSQVHFGSVCLIKRYKNGFPQCIIVLRRMINNKMTENSPFNISIGGISVSLWFPSSLIVSTKYWKQNGESWLFQWEKIKHQSDCVFNIRMRFVWPAFVFIFDDDYEGWNVPIKDSFDGGKASSSDELMLRKQRKFWGAERIFRRSG